MKNADISDLIKKAKESLDAAENLLESGFPDFSASRSYYAMFYGAEAILLTRGLAFSKHKEVISAFGKEFVKTDLIPSYLHRYLADAFDIRQAGDYGPSGSVGKEKAKKLIENTKKFIECIVEYLKKEGLEI